MSVVMRRVGFFFLILLQLGDVGIVRIGLQSFFSQVSSLGWRPNYVQSDECVIQVYGPEASMTCICKQAIDYISARD